MTGGKSGYKGYTYQTLVFLNELLSEDTISGELEKGDDLFIKKNNLNYCFQTKDYSEPLKSSDIENFLPNFIRAYNLGARKFIVHSPFGAIKKLDLDKIYKKLADAQKITPAENSLLSSIAIEFIKKSRGELEAEIKLKIGDFIKSKGGMILSDETSVIAEKIMGILFIQLREITRVQLLALIEKEGVPFITSIPEESLVNSSDLFLKYKEENFDKQVCESAIHFLTRFYFKRKKLSLNPSLQDNFALFYCAVQKEITERSIKKITLKEFQSLISDILKIKRDLELNNFLDSDKLIIIEMYNSLIGECHFRPKHETPTA